METPQDGYTAPLVVYLVEYAGGPEDLCPTQAGGFTTEAEAKKLLARLQAEGCDVHINMVAIHRAVTDWEWDR